MDSGMCIQEVRARGLGLLGRERGVRVLFNFVLVEGRSEGGLEAFAHHVRAVVLTYHVVSSSAECSASGVKSPFRIC